MLELKAGGVEIMLEISDFANILHIHPVHLSNYGKSKLQAVQAAICLKNAWLSLSKEMLASTNLSVAEIARQLTYDPSNFTKFFKKFVKMTPKEYRNSL